MVLAEAIPDGTSFQDELQGELLGRCSMTVIRKACARFSGFVLLAVLPFRGFRAFHGFHPRNPVFSENSRSHFLPSPRVPSPSNQPKNPILAENSDFRDSQPPEHKGQKDFFFEALRSTLKSLLGRSWTLLGANCLGNLPV